jgi:hypothetical protein
MNITRTIGPERSESDAIGIFVSACEELNNFARLLWTGKIFENAQMSADIRMYDSGWRLEKYVEAVISAKRDWTVAWCLELGRSDENWIVLASIEISHSQIHFDLGKRTAADEGELQLVLDEMVKKLKESVFDESELQAAIKTLN